MIPYTFEHLLAHFPYLGARPTRLQLDRRVQPVRCLGPP